MWGQTVDTRTATDPVPYPAESVMGASDQPVMQPMTERPNHKTVFEKIAKSGVFINNNNDGLKGWPNKAQGGEMSSGGTEAWAYNPAVWSLLAESTRVAGRYRGVFGRHNTSGGGNAWGLRHVAASGVGGGAPARVARCCLAAF